MFLFNFAFVNISSQALDLVHYVNPFVGTSDGGNTHPGSQMPWGMVSMTPQNVDYMAPGYHAVGYVHGEEKFFGFAHTHLSGVGCPDMGSILLLPFYGDTDFDYLTKGVSYNNESASAAYYKVDIGNNPVSVTSEVTATTRTGMGRFYYPQDTTAKMFLNLGRSLSKNRGAVVRIVNDSIIEGYKVDGSFGNRAAERRVYFSMKFSRGSKIAQIFDKARLKPLDQQRAYGEDIGVYLEFSPSEQPLLVKTGISYVNVDNARLNLEEENPDWDFDMVHKKARSAWNRELSRIYVSEESESNRKLFYTALYHTLIHPNIISDINGEYPLMGERQGVGCNTERPRYSVFSLWDTYRNVHPLLTLVYPEVQSQMLASMVDMYKENSWLPKWEVISNESFTMVGDPSLPVIADSYIKGIRDFDYKTAYEAMLKHAFTVEENIIRPGHKPYVKYGYIPQDDKGGEYVWGSLSTSLEYNFADWALSQMAKAIGDEKNYQILLDRSMNYHHFWDREYKLLRPRMKDGSFLEPFDPLDIRSELGWTMSGGRGYVEGNAWQYTWFVPHDISGLIKLFGGEDIFVSKLQECFDKEYFSLSNEPDMAYPFLFNYVNGQQWRTQIEVDKCIKNNFTDFPSGLPGNDDCGTISTWLIFAMMGFYPDCVASINYSVFAPTFEKIEIKLNNQYYQGNSIVIERMNSKQTPLIKKYMVNGVERKSFFISHEELISGVNIQFVIK